MTFEYETERALHGPIAQMMPNLEDHVRCLGGVDPLSITIEDLPDPPIVQRFVMVVESDSGIGPWDATRWTSDEWQRNSSLPMSFREGKRRVLSFTEAPDA